MAKKVSDEFLEHIVETGKQKLTQEQLWKEFVDGGYYERVKASMPEHVREATQLWDDNTWKLYIYNYAKIQFNIKVAFGEVEYKKILN